MQAIVIAGNIGKDAEVKHTPKGDSYASFSVGVSKGRDSETTWYNCAFFGKRGEGVAQYLTKGSQVTVAGDFSFRKYTKKDGAEGQSLEIRVNDVKLQGGKRDGGSSSGASDGAYKRGRSAGDSGEAPEDPHASGGFGDDDSIPF